MNFGPALLFILLLVGLGFCCYLFQSKEERRIWREDARKLKNWEVKGMTWLMVGPFVFMILYIFYKSN